MSAPFFKVKVCMAKRYNYKDNFEMLMLRHDYLNKVKDPDPKWCVEFAGIVKTTSGIMYDKLRPNFAKVGYEKEDLETIANCLMVAYMGLYSLRNSTIAMERFEKAFYKRKGRHPNKSDIAKKERINMISFLRQKLQYASIICARKARNIIVDADKRTAYAFTQDSVPASESAIFERGEQLGYRPVLVKELKEIKKQAKLLKTKELKDEFGFPIIEIDVMTSLAGGLTEKDYTDLFIQDKKDRYHLSPEQCFEEYEEKVELASFVNRFVKMDKEEKQGCLSKFIDSYKSNKNYADEVKTARSMLRNL